MKKIFLTLLICLLPLFLQAEEIKLEKNDYIAFLVGNYVHGFKEFDTTVVAFEDSISVGIYYDKSIQSIDRANELAKRFREQIPLFLKKYKWASDVKTVVNVYSEDRTERRY